jgi:hypothetical protein
MRTIFVLGVLVMTLLSGCADTPFVITGMNSERIKQVPNDALCNTYQFNGFYAGDTYTVREEVRRRGIDCGMPGSSRPSNAADSLMLIQTGTQLMQQGRRQPNPVDNPTAPAAFLRNSYVSGLNRICLYDRLGSQVAVTIPATAICPLGRIPISAQ